MLGGGVRGVGIALWILLVLPAIGRANDTYETYFTFVDPGVQQRSFSDPLALAPALVKNRMMVSLLNWQHNPHQFPRPPEPYVRERHYGSWVRDPRDGTCYDTRAKVLMRSSRRPVTFSSRDRCRVESGDWLDPFAGRVHHLAERVHIDHFVALSNSYHSGASRWTYQARCLFGNYMGNEFHLMAVDGGENVRKGNKTPADWLPPNTAVRCDYIRAWLTIKMIWGLVLSPREAAGIRAAIQSHGCNMSAYAIPADYLAQQRQLIGQNMGLCARP